MSNFKEINTKQAFESISEWITEVAQERDAPGLLVSVSGTDSILTFLACAKALDKLGKADRMCAIYYEPSDSFHEAHETGKSVNSGLTSRFNWMADGILPWLKEQAPKATIKREKLDNFTDMFRWARTFQLALAGASTQQRQDKASHYWTVGTRNATEQALGKYSNSSGAVSMQPLIHLWKSDILTICKDLGVPEIAIEKSQEGDYDCWRTDVIAKHIRQIDSIIQMREGVLPKDSVEIDIDPEIWQELEAFVDHQYKKAAFKKQIPYRPAPSRRDFV